MIPWETVKDDFRWDGSLRDIYITPATMDDWGAVYVLLRDYPDAEFLVDGGKQPLPPKTERIFELHATSSPMLRIQAGRALVVFHFLSSEEVECDVDPREVVSQADLDALLGFVRQLGEATKKKVVITPENLRSEPIISYSPETGAFQYHQAVI
ncbi:MAG: hypothetical protein P4N60_14465 [Verrucomicrobiae bacterium]|nr:hypothetical protein [Verrucomicrobiae bacterium]